MAGRFLKILKAAAIIVAVGGAVLLAIPFLSGWTRAMIYPVPRYPVVTPDEIESLTLDASSGSVHAWLYPRKSAEKDTSRGPDKPVAVFFHGNGENLGALWDYGLFTQLVELDIYIVAVDYPGYGNSAGKPSEPALIESGHLALDRAVSLFPDSPVIVMGWSLGAAVAAQIAAADPSRIHGLILMSPWTSLNDVASVHFPRWLVKVLLSERYDTESLAPRLNLPVLVLHGDRDRIIPVEQGKRVADALPNAVWVPVPGYGHGDLFGSSMVAEQWSRFFTAIRNR